MLTCTAFDAVDDLPAAARALFGGDFFSGLAWYRTLIAHGMPAGGRAVLLVFSAGAVPRAVVPMWVAGRRAGSLTSLYTCRGAVARVRAMVPLLRVGPAGGDG
jgi:hypothetical protein